jgi:hypothetical protein
MQLFFLTLLKIMHEEEKNSTSAALEILSALESDPRVLALLHEERNNSWYAWWQSRKNFSTDGCE